MMMRAWLILADILIVFLLFASFILFYLYSPQKETFSLPHLDERLTSEVLNLPTIDLNATITLEDLIAMRKEEYTIENRFLTRTLQEGLKSIDGEVGYPVFIRIFKEASLLEIWMYAKGRYRHLKDYKICAYSGLLGPKLQEGDRQAPEGFYRVKKHQLNPNSKFHLSFNLGYPNAYDRAHNRTGSFLMVHGNCVSIGCYAMTDEKIEEIYDLVQSALQEGQKYVQVHAYPFRMTEERMAFYSESQWYDFWMNLKEGYDYFEAEYMPPHVKVEKKRYTIYEANE